MNRATALCLLGSLFVVLGMSGDGCRSIPSLLPDLRPPPAVLSTSPGEDTRQRTLEVDLRRYPDAQSITWDFGDGAVIPNMAVSTGRRVSHEFTGDATYLVRAFLFSGEDVLANDPAHVIAVGSLPIDVLGPNVGPTASFAVEEVAGDSDASATLTKRFIASASRDPDGRIAQYRWAFGDGIEALGRSVSHTFSRSGRFSVRLTVTDDRGAVATTTRTILVNVSPTAAFTFQEDPNDGLQFTFDASGSSDADGTLSRFTWDFGDGTPTVEGLMVTHTYAVPDTYTVMLTIIDDSGASASDSQVLTATGTDPFVRSISPSFGVVDSTVTDATIDGENFQNGATVRLEMGADVITATSVTVQDASTILATFDLSGAALGDHDVVVQNPDTTTNTLAAGFRVVTPNRVRLTTSFGDIVMELVDDAPITTDNFLQYVDDDFYDGTIFHRVVAGFVVQGGGLLPGMVPQTGLRPPIMNEFSPARSNLRGTVAMAKVGGNPDSATSQFFVNLDDNSANLDNQNGGFTVFANVVEGMDVVDQIAAVPVDANSAPLTDVLLIRAERE